MNPDWIEDFENVERQLLERCDPKSNEPCQLLVLDGDDPERWTACVVWLIERGWRVAYDNVGELWFYAPNALTDPGDVARNLN